MKKIAALAVFLTLTIVGCAGSSTNKSSNTDAGGSNSVVGDYVQCSFGDADACKQIDSQPGGADAAAEHDAMIREQLKSPEQRATDLYGPH